MRGQFTSFLLRCWQRDDGIDRIEITRIHDGKRVVFDSVEVAVRWLVARPGALTTPAHGEDGGQLEDGPTTDDRIPPR